MTQRQPELRVAKPRRERERSLEALNGSGGLSQLRPLHTKLVVRLRVARVFFDLETADLQVRLPFPAQPVGAVALPIVMNDPGGTCLDQRARRVARHQFFVHAVAESQPRAVAKQTSAIFVDEAAVR